MIYIREFQSEYIDAVVNLFDAYRLFYKMDSNKVLAKKFLLERIANKESVIFVSENEVAVLTGFVQLYPIFSTTRLKRLWLLNDLFVDLAERGKGISKKLIQQAQKLCVETEGCGLILETAKSNVIGNLLYSATDFLLDENHNYYTWDC